MPIALVTGVTSGFGWSMAKSLIAQGYHVIGTGRRQARLDALAAELGADAARFTPLCFDVTDRAAVDAALASLPPALTDIDVLVNNAGLALGLNPAHKADLHDWETMVHTNILGLLYVTRAILPGMVARGTGDVVNISSTAGSWPYPGANVYGASKAFVTMLSLNLRADLLGTGVRVTSLEPGMAETEFSQVRFKGDEGRAKTTYAGMHALTAEDVAACLQFVLGLPRHVNINRMEIMPTQQSFGPVAVART